MTFCPHCHNKNVEVKTQRGINECDDCGSEFRETTVFTEGSYRKFMENVLNKVASELQPNAASAVINLRDHVLDDKNDIQSIVETLVDITQKVDSSNDQGYDRKSDVISIIEGIEKITNYAKVLASRDEISTRTAYRMAILEGTDPDSWLYPPEEIPDLDGEINDDQLPTSSQVISQNEPSFPVKQQPTDEIPFEETNWLGKKVKVSCREGKYNVIGENGPLITYNETTQSHDGIENFSEEQLAELDDLLGGMSDHDIDATGIDNIDPAYNGAEEGEELASPDQGAQGTITSTEQEDPAAQAVELSKSMVNDENLPVGYGSLDGLADHNEEPAEVVIDENSSLKSLPLYKQVTHNLTSQMKRGTFDEANALNAFRRVAKQSHTVEESNGGIETSAKRLLDEFMQISNGQVDGGVSNSEEYLGDEGDEDFDQIAEVDEKEKIEELAKKKVGTHDYVAKPEIIPAKREATGEAPDGHVVKYVSSKFDPSKPQNEQWSEEEAKIPFTQAEADESEVDENGKKKKDAGKKNAKDSYGEDEFKAGRPGTKGKKLDESITRFNGYRLGDKIKVPGYERSFDLVEIHGTPVKFTLTEGNVTLSVDANNDEFELDGDRDLRWQRQTTILEDTRKVWEEMEKESINEGCAGGVCTIGGPMTALNSTSGIGNVTSAAAMFIRTPIRSLSKEVSPNDVYAYIKNNSLHNSPRETAIGHVMSNFQNSNIDVEKIFDDAVGSVSSNNERLNEVDSSYGYKSISTRDIDIEETLNEGYESLKKLGIV